MAKLLYVMNASLDGYIADEDGKFDWGAPGEEYYSFINDLLRPVGTYLYGRRLYELMQVWETDPTAAAQSPGTREFAEIWQAADKVVYSRTLATASTTRTRIEPDFDPEAVRHLKAAAERDLTVGGPTLGAHAITAGLVDEVPPVRLARRGGRRQAVPPQPGPASARTAGRAPGRQRRGVPALPHPDMSSGSARSTVEVLAEELGPSLRWATATTRATRELQPVARSTSRCDERDAKHALRSAPSCPCFRVPVGAPEFDLTGAGDPRPSAPPRPARAGGCWHGESSA